MTTPSQVARACMQAYTDKDLAAIEPLIAADYRFISPLDNGLDRKTYFERCWPNSEMIEGFDIIHTADSGNLAFVVYEGRANGKTFRNCEIHEVRDGQLVRTEVYFGWDVPHRAPDGRFVHNDNDQQAARLTTTVPALSADPANPVAA